MPEDEELDPWADFKPNIRRIAKGKVRISYHIMPETRDALLTLSKALGVQPGQALDAMIREEIIRRNAGVGS